MGFGSSQCARLRSHLTCAADTPVEVRLPSHDATFRLDTLASRRNRHTQPPSDSPPSYGALFPTIPPNPYSRHLQPQNPPQRRTLHLNQTHRPTNPAFQPVRPLHPFQLDNTLARLNRNAQQAQQRYTADGTRRNNSNVSSQSSTGGVSVASNDSGSSGSSRTIRGDGGGEVSRRRRFDEIADGESDY